MLWLSQKIYKIFGLRKKQEYLLSFPTAYNIFKYYLNLV